MNRVEQLITDMEAYVDGCKTQAFNTRKIIMDRGAFDDFITDLRIFMPEVIQRSEKIVNNKETILGDAKTKADKILAEAEERERTMIDQSEYVRLATQQAEQIIAQANAQAQEIMTRAYEECDNFKSSALQYAMGSMEQLRAMLEDNMTATKSIFEEHLGNMNAQYQSVVANHESLMASLTAAQPEEEDSPEEEIPEEE